MEVDGSKLFLVAALGLFLLALVDSLAPGFTTPWAIPAGLAAFAAAFLTT